MSYDVASFLWIVCGGVLGYYIGVTAARRRWCTWQIVVAAITLVVVSLAGSLAIKRYLGTTDRPQIETKPEMEVEV